MEKQQLPESNTELAEVCIALWEKYFATPKKGKAEVMAAYNEAANEYNSRAGNNSMTILTSSTKDSSKVKPTLPGAKLYIETGTPEGVGADGKIAAIIKHHVDGKTNKEIISLGFNKSTVGRQVSEYKKRQEALKKQEEGILSE